MPNIKLVLEYDGAAFHGWQVQEGVTTVQSELKRALEIFLRRDVGLVQASGRTDAGVHARGQVVNFHSPVVPDLTRLMCGISGILIGKLAVLSAEVVPDSFNARNDAVKKQYSYTILNRAVPAILDSGRVWRIFSKLDLEKMQLEAHSLIGKHDFTSFRSMGCNANTTEREIFESEFVQEGELLVYRVVGEGFLRHMVRIIVGTLVGIGEGSIRSDIVTILKAKDRNKAGITAPAQGLCLDWVCY